MTSEFVYECTHLSWIGVPLFLGLERGPVLQPKKHFTDFIFISFFDNHDIQRIYVEPHSKVVREVLVSAPGDGLAVDWVCISRQGELAVEELPECPQSLLAVDHVISIGPRCNFVPVELRYVIVSEDSINEELLLRPAPDSGPLEIGIGVDAVADSVNGTQGPGLLWISSGATSLAR
jgi:hypothetical protein